MARRLSTVPLSAVFFILMTSSCAQNAATDRTAVTGIETQQELENTGTVTVILSTQMGQITLEIDTVRAPISATNFLHYVDEGMYAGGSFYRTVHMENQPTDSIRIEVIQAGANQTRREEIRDAIPLERTTETGLIHLDGTISMARSGPDTATASFFICIGDQPSLDFGGQRNPDGQGFAAFGRVVSDMSIVRSIQSQPADGQSLVEPIVIHAATRMADE